VCLNAEHYHAWNIRKELMCADPAVIDAEQELRFTQMVLTKHSKSALAWAHRRWIFTHTRLALDTVERITAEALLTERLCHYYAKNYYAWNHRLWTIEQLLQLEAAERANDAGPSSRQQRQDALDAELQRTGSWQQAHIGDHCGHHHRVQVLLLWARVSQGWDAATLAEFRRRLLSDAAADREAEPLAVNPVVHAAFTSAMAQATDWDRRYPNHAALASYLETLRTYLRYIRPGPE
jgi:hypothetical protein